MRKLLFMFIVFTSCASNNHIIRYGSYIEGCTDAIYDFIEASTRRTVNVGESGFIAQYCNMKAQDRYNIEQANESFFAI